MIDWKDSLGKLWNQNLSKRFLSDNLTSPLLKWIENFLKEMNKFKHLSLTEKKMIKDDNSLLDSLISYNFCGKVALNCKKRVLMSNKHVYLPFVNQHSPTHMLLFKDQIFINFLKNDKINDVYIKDLYKKVEWLVFSFCCLLWLLFFKKYPPRVWHSALRGF